MKYDWLIDIVVAIAGVVIPILAGIVAKKVHAEHRQKEIEVAATTAVLAVADRLKTSTSGAAKREAAVAEAKALKPRAFGSLPADQQQTYIAAAYSALRPSLETPSQPPEARLYSPLPAPSEGATPLPPFRRS